MTPKQWTITLTPPGEAPTTLREVAHDDATRILAGLVHGFEVEELVDGGASRGVGRRGAGEVGSGVLRPI